MTRRLDAGPLLVTLGALLLLVSLFLYWFDGEIDRVERVRGLGPRAAVARGRGIVAGVGLTRRRTPRRSTAAGCPPQSGAVGVIVASQIIDPPPAATGREPRARALAGARRGARDVRRRRADVRPRASRARPSRGATAAITCPRSTRAAPPIRRPTAGPRWRRSPSRAEPGAAASACSAAPPRRRRRRGRSPGAGSRRGRGARCRARRRAGGGEAAPEEIRGEERSRSDGRRARGRLPARSLRVGGDRLEVAGRWQGLAGRRLEPARAHRRAGGPPQAARRVAGGHAHPGDWLAEFPFAADPRDIVAAELEVGRSARGRPAAAAPAAPAPAPARAARGEPARPAEAEAGALRGRGRPARRRGPRGARARRPCELKASSTRPRARSAPRSRAGGAPSTWPAPRARAREATARERDAAPGATPRAEPERASAASCGGRASASPSAARRSSAERDAPGGRPRRSASARAGGRRLREAFAEAAPPRPRAIERAEMADELAALPASGRASAAQRHAGPPSATAAGRGADRRRRARGRAGARRRSRAAATPASVEVWAPAAEQRAGGDGAGGESPRRSSSPGLAAVGGRGRQGAVALHGRDGVDAPEPAPRAGRGRPPPRRQRDPRRRARGPRARARCASTGAGDLGDADRRRGGAAVARRPARLHPHVIP